MNQCLQRLRNDPLPLMRFVQPVADFSGFIQWFNTIKRDNAEVRELINAAEFKYADGISVVRSVRKKYPQAQVSRVAGADQENVQV